MIEIEATRLAAQAELDSAKTPLERNKLGQFATPSELATQIVRYILKTYDLPQIRFIEPAVGTGSFVSALFAQASDRVQCALGVEVDSAVVHTARALWAGSALDVVEADFTKLNPRGLFNLLITNPPYVRHHHIAAEDKKRLVNWARDRFQMPISALTGLYCHFMYKAHEWMEPGAVSVWLIPSEFMDVNYGQALKQYLTNHVTLDRIHRFEPHDVQFTDALVSSAIVLFRNQPPALDHEVRMTYGGALEAPVSEQLVAVSTLRTSRKWSRFPGQRAETEHHQGLVLGDLFNVKRGLATGANNFFILDRQEAASLGIPEDCVKPVLPSSRHLHSDIISQDSEGFPLVDRQLALIDCRLDEETIRIRHPLFWQYLQRGLDLGINKGYLSLRRRPWYSQEDRPPALFLCTYMGRSKIGGVPVKFFLNLSRATATNVYLLLYPKPWLREALTNDPELALRLINALNTIQSETFAAEGRVYGGGLQKLEPRELMRVAVPQSIAKAIESLYNSHQLSLLEK